MKKKLTDSFVKPSMRKRPQDMGAHSPELSRKERKALAKKHGYDFAPIYNNQAGVVSYEEFYGTREEQE